MFNVKKATDMAIYLLKKNEADEAIDGTNYTKLLKLMYLAERESYSRYAEPMCGDDLFSLPQGPILSKVLNFMRREIQDTRWTSLIDTKGYNLVLKAPNTKGYKQLSRAEKSILDTLWDAHKNKTYKQMCDWTHTHCSEWEDVNKATFPGKQDPISVRKLMKNAGVKNVDAALKHFYQSNQIDKELHYS